MTEDHKTKKALILETAREIGAEKWTAAEIDQLRRRMIAEHGEEAKTGADYIADVLQTAGLKVTLSQLEEVEDQFEDEFEDLLHFKTLGDAEVSLMRLDELWRRFHVHGEKAAAGRVLDVARLGKRRAEMIARNRWIFLPIPSTWKRWISGQASKLSAWSSSKPRAANPCEARTPSQFGPASSLHS